jgi:hypothetical protein
MKAKESRGTAVWLLRGMKVNTALMALALVACSSESSQRVVYIQQNPAGEAGSGDAGGATDASFDAADATRRDSGTTDGSRDALPESTCPDCDGDGFAPPEDCDDTDPRARPDTDPKKPVIAWITPRSGGGWDFDCDGVEEPGYGLYVCGSLEPATSYVAEVPPCGGSAPAFHRWNSDGTACGTATDVRPMMQVCR